MQEQQFRIPTLVALVLIAGFSIGGLFAYESITSFLGSARTINVVEPKNVHISNVTDSSFVVSWTTDQPIAAYIEYGIGSPDKKAYDIRDSDQIPKQYKTHYVKIADLPAESIVSVLIKHSDTSFPINSVVLGQVITNPPQILPLYGELETADGTVTQGAIIYAVLNENIIWSTFISEATGWVIPLASIRTGDLAAYYCTAQTCSDTTAVTITVAAEEGTQSIETNLGNARPVDPILRLGSAGKSTAADTAPSISPIGVSISPTAEPTGTPAVQVRGIQASPTPHASPTPANVQPSPTSAAAQWNISILAPKENAHLRFPKPLIRGEGIPGTTVEIMLESGIKQIDTVQVKDDGTWLWTPKVSLEPGEHTLTIVAQDRSGRNITLKRRFAITKSGEQVLAAGSPSASLAPTATPTQSIIPTSTPIIPTATPTPVLPTSASIAPSILVLLGGIILVVLGVAVL